MENQTAQNQTPVQPSQRPFPLLLVILSILALLLLSSTTYLAYQNMQLTRQIAELSKPIPSPTPTGTQNPTTNSKLYTSSVYGFELESPNDLGTLDLNNYQGSVTVNGNTYQTIQLTNGISPSINIIKNWTNTAVEPYFPNINPQISSINGITWSIFYDPQGGVPRCDSASFETLTQDKKNTIFISYMDENHCPGDSQKKSSVLFLNQILSTFKFTDQVGDPNQKTITDLANNFYTALTNHDGKTLFSLMTSPVTANEKLDYSWLTGEDLGGANPTYRVFLRSKIDNQQITKIQKQDDSSYLVSLTDQAHGYSNAGVAVGFTTPQTRNISMRVVNTEGQWLVDKFTYLSYAGGNAQTPKYDGFGQ